MSTAPSQTELPKMKLEPSADSSVTEAKFEIVPAELHLAPEQKQSLEASFAGFFKEAHSLRDQTATITNPKMARTARLAVRTLRNAAEKKRKELKEDGLRMGKAIDGANNILLAIIVPIEKRLEDIEREEERKEGQRIATLAQARRDQLVPLGVAEAIVASAGLGMMSEEAFQTLLADSKALHEARIERERKAEEDRLAKEVAEAKERERIRLENERLLKEAVEREEAARVEREKAAAEKAALEAKIAQERKEAEAKAGAEAERVRKEKEEAARAAADLLKKAQAAAEAQRREAEEKALRQQAEAQRLRAEAEAQARSEREALEKKAADEREAREKLERETAQAEAARIAEVARKLEAAEKALLAPDKDKLISVALAVRGILLPTVKAKKAVAALEQFRTKIGNLADWIEEKAQEL